MRKILVLRGGALGDFIVTLPALALLRQRWPDARIELAGNATAAQLARNRGLLDQVHSQHEARWAGLYGSNVLAPAFADWLSEFDLVLNYWPDPDGHLAKRFPMRGEQTFLSASALPERGPAASHYCEPLRALGLATNEYYFRLVPEWARKNPTESLAIHPGSGSARKNWRRENWLALIARLPSPMTLILGEAEREAWQQPPQSAAPLECLVDRTLEELVTRLAGSRLFLGHDSGISHLAAACGVPCVLLFGPTDPAVWAPPAPNVRVLRCGPDPEAITIEVVYRAAMAAFADQR